MRKYEIIFCFTDSKGNVQKDENGLEQYFLEVVEAYNKGEAIEKLNEKEKFLVKPEIINIRIVEVQNNARVI